MTTIRSLAIFFALLIGAAPAFAAELSIGAPLAGAETPFLLPVVFNPGKDVINVVEGSIVVPPGLEIDRIDTAGSAFSLFASGPTYDLSSGAIEFTAGAPHGLASDKVALLFIVHARASAPGVYTLTPEQVAGYENDGKGTRVAVSAQSTSVTVGVKGSANVDGFPPSAPSALVADIGKDRSLFDGKWFVTFYGGDAGASIDHYEVREGWWRPSVRADRYYILKDQSRSTTVWVDAISENGKVVTVMMPPAHPWMERIILALLTLAGFLVCVMLWKVARRISKK